MFANYLHFLLIAKLWLPDFCSITSRNTSDSQIIMQNSILGNLAISTIEQDWKGAFLILCNVETSEFRNLGVFKHRNSETLKLCNFECLKNARARAWGTHRQILLGHQPWALSHEPWGMRHEPRAMSHEPAMNYSITYDRYQVLNIFQEFQ